jgi:hypothetical protein
MGLNLTVMSYRGSLDVGIVADREQIPDVWKLIDWLHEALDELKPIGLTLTEAAPPTNGSPERESAAAPVPGGDLNE